MSSRNVRFHFHEKYVGASKMAEIDVVACEEREGREARERRFSVTEMVLTDVFAACACS